MISGSALVEIAPIATKFSCPGLTTKPCFIIIISDDNHVFAYLGNTCSDDTLTECLSKAA